MELIPKCTKTRLHQCRIKKLASLTSRSRGEGHGRGSWGMAERGGGRQLESPTHQFRLKSCTASSPGYNDFPPDLGVLE